MPGLPITHRSRISSFPSASVLRSRSLSRFIPMKSLWRRQALQAIYQRSCPSDDMDQSRAQSFSGSLSVVYRSPCNISPRLHSSLLDGHSTWQAFPKGNRKGENSGAREREGCVLRVFTCLNSYPFPWLFCTQRLPHRLSLHWTVEMKSRNSSVRIFKS